MKKHLFSTLLGMAALTLLSSCISDSSDEDPSESRVIEVALSFQTKAGALPPVVNSVRVIAFDGNATCALNSIKTSGLTLTPMTGGYSISLGEFQLKRFISAKYDLYAIINEDGYVVDGTEETLTDLIEDNITVGERSLNLFLSYFNAPAEYSPTAVPISEPAFLMGSVSSYTLSEGDSKTPATVEFNMARRSLAQVTIDAITSEPVSGSYTSTEVPKIFVLGVSLENVPSSMAWSAGGGSLGSNPTSIPIGAAGTGGYYDRFWSGTLSQAVSVNATRTQTTDVKLWRTTKDSNNGWSNDGTLAYSYTDKNDGNAYNAATGGIKKISEKYENKADNGVKAVLDLLSSSFNVTSTTYAVTSLASQGLSTPSSDYWTVSLGQSYYIPENIADARGTETYIKVRVAVSNPSLDLSGMVAAHYPVPTALNEEESSLSHRYCIEGQDMSYTGKIMWPDAGGTLKETDKWMPLLFAANGHVVDASTGSVVTAASGSKEYKAYVDGFTREADGTGNVTVSSATSGAPILWNVPTSGDNVYELCIPVNNGVFDSDYSVRRNTKYTITLHITDATSLTKAAGCGPALEATVTAEKINDDED